MNRRQMSFTPTDYVIYGLAIVGVLMSLFKNLLAILIPILIIGGLFAYNRYLGNRSRGYRPTSSARPSSNRFADARKKSKTVPFRVIPGTKDSDDEPKVH
ncbi:hypothetical protein [Gorillibacterium timonense]|uniref:hypothetical protein n=1 Tax=Gorillibacterium timonense TaxID=1689269 RepID=UPI00071D52C5|nr:hypothetical protein [Gorillibacterium timonense]